MQNKNPFTLMYGISSESSINRDEELNKILKSFIYDNAMYMYLIVGIRGSGKTVLLRNAYDIISKNDNWVCVDINPQGDIISSLANKLSITMSTKKLLDGWSFSINLPYLTITKEKKETINDPEIISEKIIEKLASESKKILITIDEVNKTNHFKKFVNFYQSLIGKGLPVYLLMTGLKENINIIENDSSMTFLTRAPKIELEPLGLPSIALEYKTIFNIPQNLASEMAKLTNGYAFAYQVLGYLFYEDEKRKINDIFLQKYDSYLWNNGYNKFWNDLTQNEKNFLIALSLCKDGTKNEILEKNIISESNYSQYRKRLIEKGLIVSNKYGSVSFVLPRFDGFISYAKEFN